MSSSPANPGSTDTPITIGDGSLKLISTEKRWSDWNPIGPDDDEKQFPGTNLKVVDVAVTIGANTTHVPFNSQKCEVTSTGTLNSAANEVSVKTHNDGTDLRVKIKPKKFSDFTPDPGGFTLVGGVAGDHITSVEVKQQGQQVFFQDNLNGGTSVTITLR